MNHTSCRDILIIKGLYFTVVIYFEVRNKPLQWLTLELVFQFPASLSEPVRVVFHPLICVLSFDISSFSEKQKHKEFIKSEASVHKQPPWVYTSVVPRQKEVVRLKLYALKNFNKFFDI